jgi:hypothetical protein
MPSAFGYELPFPAFALPTWTGALQLTPSVDADA